MLRDDQNARLSVIPDPAAPREDPFLKAVQGAAAEDFTVLGEIGRGNDGVIIYLSREVASGRLVALRLQREGQLAHEFSLELVRHLDNSMPAPESKCFKCGKPIRGWARFCSYCGADLSGAVSADAGGDAAMLAALNEAVADDYEVLGEMSRSEGGGAVYFARDRQSNRIVALRLQREGTDDAFSVGETSALKPLAASLGVKPVATQLLGSLVPKPAAAAAAPPPAAAHVPPPQPARPAVPPPLVARPGMTRRTQLILGAAGVVILAVLALVVFSPEQKAAPLPKPVAIAPDTAVSPPAAVVTPPPPPAAAERPEKAAVTAPAPHPTTGSITVTHLANDADVRIDGAKWTPNKPIRLAAGSHVLNVAVAGYLPYADTVHLAAGESREVAPQLVVQPKPVASDAPRKSAATPPPGAPSWQCEKLMEAKDWHGAAQQCTTEAGAGSVVAKRNLGLLYNHGNGVSSSDDDAVRWYKQAVDGGDAMAMYLLGTFYEHGGGGIKKDQATAAQLYTRSAEGGYVLAQRTLAEAFEKGHLGEQKNKAQALVWYRKAAAQGDKDAIDKVKDLDKP